MKTSLLLLGLVMGTGVVGTAQATDMTARSYAPDTLVAASTSGDGVLSALGNLLSRESRNDTRDCDITQASGKTGPQPVPGPTFDRHHHQGPDTDAALPPAATAGDGAQPPTDTLPGLGWQSLLPGSIQ